MVKLTPPRNHRFFFNCAYFGFYFFGQDPAGINLFNWLPGTMGSFLYCKLIFFVLWCSVCCTRKLILSVPKNFLFSWKILIHLQRHSSQLNTCVSLPLVSLASTHREHITSSFPGKPQIVRAEGIRMQEFLGLHCGVY